MTVKLMRYIDYWLGVPLCFLLSIWNFILRTSGVRRKNETRKILLIKLSEIGAVILAYPLLKRLKEEYPSAEIFFLTFAKNKEVFSLLGEIIPDKNILTIREESIGRFILDTSRAVKKIRKEGIDIVFDLEFFSRFTAILAYLSKASKRVGFYRYAFEGLYRGNLLTHNVQYNPLTHISKTYLSLLQVVKKEKKSSSELEERIEEREIVLPKFNSSVEIKNRIENRLKEHGISKESRFFLINPGEGNLPLREWPLESFIDIAKRLLDDRNNCIIIVGTEKASGKVDLLCSRVKSKRCINLTGRTTLCELLEIFGIAEALITNDCGLAHLASLTPIKKFMLFGPESPQIFSPLGENNRIFYSNLPCSPCLSVFNHRNSACKDNKCLKMISPDDVYKVIKGSFQLT